VTVADEALDRLNALDAGDLADALRRCCGSQRWVREVAARAPFSDQAGLFAAADSAWSALDGAEWRAAHEAVGDRTVPAADAGTRAAIDVALRLYRERFGHRFIAAHDQLTAEELLMRIRIRLGNEVVAETRKTRAEQRLIARRRLEALLAAPDDA
jgi:2-oxo-4-hydroxy-4-carboxy-5-ureidoimidazoline decarboxylase